MGYKEYDLWDKAMYLASKYKRQKDLPYVREIYRRLVKGHSKYQWQVEANR